MKFYYKKIASGIYRPIIPIELLNLGRRLRYEVLIDSGADFCIFDHQISEILNINLANSTRTDIQGIGGTKNAFSHQINLSVGGHECRVDARFMKEIPTTGYGILGQKGFFENFQVKFDYPKAEIEIKPILHN